MFQQRILVASALLLLNAPPFVFAQNITPSPTSPGVGGKEVLIPERISRVPEGNDFNDPESEFSFERSKSTDHFVLFWSKEYGDDPMANPVENKRFDVDAVLRESDRFYEYFVDTLKWVDKETSLATRYKFLIFVIGGDGGTAFGGSIDNRVGAFWTPATRIHQAPYGVVAHELGHSFQALVRADGAERFSGGSIGEMTSQYMLWQVYPEWMTFENYHLDAFMEATHLAFLHEANQYHTAYRLEYWSGKHGVELIGTMWREVQRGEDPVMTYKRLTGISQQEFNDEMFDAARRFVTWDLPRVETVAARYANQHFTSVEPIADDWYRIAPDKCPQNYGYNAIQLQVPNAGSKVSLEFKGIVGVEGFNRFRPENAGWRYGFLASRTDGTRVYGDIHSQSSGTAEFTVPSNTDYLWLVVTGAPTEHWIHVSQRRRRGQDREDNTTPVITAEWPYQFKLTGTQPVTAVIE